MSRLGLAVERSVHVASFYAAVHVAQKYFHSFFASQLFFVGTFYSHFSNEVARAVVVVIVDILLRNFAHVAKYVRPYAVSIAAYDAAFNVKAFELEKFLFNLREFLCRYLAKEQLLGVARIAGVFNAVFYFEHTFYVELLGYAECAAEVERVDSVLLVHYDVEVVGRFVVNEQFPVAVGNKPARRVLDFFQESVRVGVLFIVIA